MVGEIILLVDEEECNCELISFFLEQKGYQVITACSGVGALEVARVNKPDLIILDILLTELGGIEVCQELRKMTTNPILFLSARGEDEDKVLALAVGGDDYLTKPFSPAELLARVKAHLRRSRMTKDLLDQQDNITLAFPGLVINVAFHTVTVNEVTVSLSAKEFKLLVQLARHPNRVFSQEELYQAIWDKESCGDTRTLMVHISNLRKKIEPDPDHPRFIQTVRGCGYKFCAGGPPGARPGHQASPPGLAGEEG